MNIYHALIIASAIAIGLSGIADAIRHANITLKFGNAMIVTTEQKPEQKKEGMQ